MRKWLAPLASHVRIDAVFEHGGDVSETVLRVARERQADLIVMGTRGRSASAATLLGSVVEQTIISSHVPVLAVKEYGSQLGVLRALLDKTRLWRPAPVNVHREGETHSG